MEFQRVPEEEDWCMGFRKRRFERMTRRLMRRSPFLWLFIGLWLAGSSGAATWMVVRVILILLGVRR